MDNVGSIFYDARIETKNFDRDASTVENRASQVASSVEKSGGGFRNFASQASESFNSVADGIGRVLKSAVLLGTTGAFGIGAATKASWDQVAAVEQATVGLRAYERDGSKVNAVLKDLITYARSDLGVLFNRKDLFESAQMMKINGVATGDLNKNVQILSRSVGLGLGNWQDLNAVVGRVISTGRLTGVEFDLLRQAGFKLDDSLRNTDISATSLFETLDKGIPVNAMEGQANTIRGIGIRMETAFRGIGDAILGVDADTSKFIKGGLGDRLIGILGTMTTLLKSPDLKEGFAKMGQGIASFAEKAIPILIEGFTWLVNNMDTVVAGFAALTVAFVAAKVAAIGFSIAASANPVGLIVAAIIALIAGLTYLQIKFDIFGKAMAFIKPVTDQVGVTFTNLYNIFVTYILPILQQIATFVMGQLKTAWDQIIASINTITAVLSPYISQTQLLQVVLYALLIPLGLVVGAIVAFITIVAAVIVIIARVIGFISSLIAVYFQLSAAVTSAMAQFVGAVVGGFNTAIGWINRFPQAIQGVFAGAGSWLVNSGKSVIQGFIDGIKSMIGAAGNAAKSVVDSVKSFMPGSPAERGPFSGRGWTPYRGKALVEGFAQGITSAGGLASGAMLGVMNGLDTDLSMNPSVGSLSSLGSSSSGIGGSVYNINSINIGSEVDGDRWLRRLTGDQEIISKGLTPRTEYA